MKKIYLWLFLYIMLIKPCLAIEIIGHSDSVYKLHTEKYQIHNNNEISFTYKDESGEKSYDKIPVFPNCTMLIPELGERQVCDLTIQQLEELILKEITSLQEVEIFIYRKSNNISVLGEVKSPGSYNIDDIQTIYDGLAKAGGFSKVAKKSKVKLIRSREDGTRTTYIIDFPDEIFNAYEAKSGVGKEVFMLQEGDLIYVEGSIPRKLWEIFKQAASIATFGIFSGLINAAID